MLTVPASAQLCTTFVSKSIPPCRSCWLTHPGQHGGDSSYLWIHREYTPQCSSRHERACSFSKHAESKDYDGHAGDWTLHWYTNHPMITAVVHAPTGTYHFVLAGLLWLQPVGTRTQTVATTHDAVASRQLSRDHGGKCELSCCILDALVVPWDTSE